MKMYILAHFKWKHTHTVLAKHVNLIILRYQYANYNTLFTRNKVGCSTKDIRTCNNHSDRKVPQKQLM